MDRTNETIQNRNTKKGDFVSLNQLIKITNKQDYKSYFQSKEGAYIPFNFSEKDIKKKQESIKSIISKSHGLNVSFLESFLKSVNNARIIIGFGSGYCVVIFYFFAQFKSHKQPFIVMLTITFGITGALFTIWLFNESLVIMSIIGLVVLIGILDNYYIMKIDTMYRSVNSNTIIEIIKSSCEKRLKSQIMTFLTTILGGLPVLDICGLGSELQKHLALSVIGGMCLGLFISLSFLPLIYWFGSNSRKNNI
jgi:multidrug efflux pump subunit AcrB